MISIRESFRKRLGDEEMVKAFFDQLIKNHGMEFNYFVTELDKGSYFISDDEMKAREADMNVPIFARIPNTHIGYLFDMENVFDLDGEYCTDAPVIFGMCHGDIFAGLEEEDYVTVNEAIAARRQTFRFDEGDEELFIIKMEDLES